MWLSPSGFSVGGQTRLMETTLPGDLFGEAPSGATIGPAGIGPPGKARANGAGGKPTNPG